MTSRFLHQIRQEAYAAEAELDEKKKNATPGVAIISLERYHIACCGEKKACTVTWESRGRGGSSEAYLEDVHDRVIIKARFRCHVTRMS